MDLNLTFTKRPDGERLIEAGVYNVPNVIALKYVLRTLLDSQASMEAFIDQAMGDTVPTPADTYAEREAEQRGETLEPHGDHCCCSTCEPEEG